MFKSMKKAILVASLLSVSALSAAPAVIFDSTGKFDKGFNESAYNGAEKFKKEFNTKYLEFVLGNQPKETVINSMLRRGGSPVLAIGFNFTKAIEKVAKSKPKSKFALIDSVVDLPNVASVVFKEHEGSFLVGALAAMKSKTGAVGFIGGMDIPLIRKFACGYKQGAQYVNPKIKVFQNMAGTTPAAWTNPSKGGELAKVQMANGVDVVYAAAGATSLGVYQAAADNHKYAIGVDSNQNYLHPGVMLTSMVKRVDNAVYKIFKSAKNGEFKPGIQSLGLAEGGVDWALDEHNRKLVTKKMEDRVNKIKADIISGKIKVNSVCK